jgi:hypothetical protein
MPSTKQEHEYEESYRQKVEKNGGEYLKVQVLGRQGYPDRLALRGLGEACRIFRRYAGPFVVNINMEECEEIVREIIGSAIHFTEHKKPKGRYQPKQPHVIKKLRRMGYRVDVVVGDEVES